MPKWCLRPVLSGLGVGLLGLACVRLYRLIRTHLENPLFAPQLVWPCLSLWIASSVIRIGRRSGEPTFKEAITLIRSGSLLLGIWGYRVYRDWQAASPVYLDTLYAILGGVIMLLGLKTSRALQNAAPPEGSRPLP
jgi:hypothetical protein